MAQEHPGVITWRETPQGLRAFLVKGSESTLVQWAPQPGSQEAFLACPVYEALLHGNRGGGKTDSLIMDFAQHVGQGFGADWRGILFRQTYPQLKDVIEKSHRWFSTIFPQATYNKSEHEWTFPTGEVLLFRHMNDPKNYWDYHGHAYPWIGWEELTSWPSSDCYLAMMSCVRSTRKDMPRKVRATCNPYGAGHSWIKHRWQLPHHPSQIAGPVIRDSMGGDGDIEPPRVAIRSKLEENKILLSADPEYLSRILASASNEAMKKAWRDGDWCIVAGGMFSDLWDARCHVIQGIPFDAIRNIPSDWYIDRSFDHGQTAPFSVGFWARSNGEPWHVGDQIIGPVRGDIFRFAEWYGAKPGKPNVGLELTAKKIGEGIVEREIEMGLRGRVNPGPADNNIFNDYDPGSSFAGDMESKGVFWTRSDKSGGSRKQGWLKIRELLTGALPGKDGPREEPGLFIADRCADFVRTVPVLSRLDNDMDDIDTRTEDHIADETRYRVRAKDIQIHVGSFR